MLNRTTRRIAFKQENLDMTRSGRKTETRRVSPSITADDTGPIRPDAMGWFSFSNGQRIRYKHGVVPGDYLIVTEPFYHIEKWHNGSAYCVNIKDRHGTVMMHEVSAERFGLFRVDLHRLRPARFMPNVFTRTVIQVTDIWMERLTDITPEAVIREGFDGIYADGQLVLCEYTYQHGKTVHNIKAPPVRAYLTLWDYINSKPDRCSAANPWVTVVQYKAVCT